MIGELAQIRSWGDATSAVRKVWVADSLRGRFARGAVWSLVGAVVAQVSTLAASVIAARLLGREQFGEYGMIQSTVGMLGIFAGLGLGVTSTKYVAEYRVSDPDRAGRIIALGTAVAIMSGGLLAFGMFVFAPSLADRTLNAPALAEELRIACVLLFCNAFNGAQTGALSGFEAFRAIARINMMRGVMIFPITLGLVVLWGLPGAIWATTLTAAATCYLSQRSLRLHCSALRIEPKFSSAWRERRILWTFSTPALLGSALVGPVTWVANTMLVNQPGGYAEMGLFSAANQWRTAIAFVPGVLAQFALPLLSHFHGTQDTIQYDKTLRWNLILTTLAASGVALPVMLGSVFIMRLYGSAFQHGWPVLALSCATAVLVCVNGVVGTAIASEGAVWAGLALNAIWAATFLGSCSFLVPEYQAAGLALALLISYGAHSVWQSTYLYRRGALRRRAESK